MKISATIITLNEEVHLARCLESIEDIVDEIIVVDSESTDKTREVAECCGVRFFSRPWSNYSDQKNFASSQANHDWVLSLDADECLSFSLRAALLALKESTPLAEAYAFPRKAFYLGRWIHHSGWYPDYKTRLHLKKKAHWEGEYVHETLVVQGRIARIDGDLLHYTCESVAAHARSLDRYTTLAAQDLWNRGEKCTPSRMLGSSLGAFLKTFFLKAGFLDGIHGFFIASFAAYYNFLKFAKLWELERQGVAKNRP
jgi:glycosyltransferase involved in cell wall biosynthesis